MKQQTFSIYLLKDGYNDTNCFKTQYKERLEKLERNQWNNNTIEDASLFLQKNFPKPPAWKDYFGISKEINNELQGSILIIPIKQEIKIYHFAITFGHAYHALMKHAIDHNFGLITTLNSLEPEESIRSLDTVYPESNKRERILSPRFTSLSFFQFNKYESLVKSLQGKVKKEYKEIFNNIIGTVSFKCSSKKPLSELKKLCSKLLEIYSKEDYIKSVPELTYIKPESDPKKIQELNNKLLSHIHSGNDILLSIPNMIDSNIPLNFLYSGIDNISEEYDDVLYENYKEYLLKSKINLKNLLIEDLYQHSITLINLDTKEELESSSIYDCFAFDAILDKEHYHLCDGSWYKISKDYISILKKELDPIFISHHPALDPFNHQNEGAYNEEMGNMEKYAKRLCLDKLDISPKGQTTVEPCDIIRLDEDNTLDLIHIKIDTKSSSLSHLFNQGLNSICLIRSNDEARNNMNSLLSKNPNFNQIINMKNRNYKVTYGIITKKNINNKSENLPLFSRISLLRCLEQFKLLGIECRVVFIKKIV